MPLLTTACATILLVCLGCEEEPAEVTKLLWANADPFAKGVDFNTTQWKNTNRSNASVNLCGVAVLNAKHAQASTLSQHALGRRKVQRGQTLDQTFINTCILCCTVRRIWSTSGRIVIIFFFLSYLMFVSSRQILGVKHRFRQNHMTLVMRNALSLLAKKLSHLVTNDVANNIVLCPLVVTCCPRPQ